MLKFPKFVVNYLVNTAKKTPYFPIPAENGSGTYMERHWIIHRDKNWPIAARIHRILLSDTGVAHDHPWWNISVILEGGYYEMMPAAEWDLTQLPKELHGQALEGMIEPFKVVKRQAGDIVFRKAHTRHKLIVPKDGFCVSLFITGRKTQEWGFYTEEGKVHWEVYKARKGI